jgi:hypothetical protein
MKDKFVNITKSPWMTNGIFKSISKKNKLYKQFLKKATRKNETDYKKYKNKLNHVIKTAQKAYYEKQFVNYKNDTKQNMANYHNSTIYNSTFQTGKIPNFLKLAIISPIYKANENNFSVTKQFEIGILCFSLSTSRTKI